MPDIPKPTGDVLRRNAERECGQPVGQINITVHGLSGFQTVSFYCNQPRLHTDECRFEGEQVVVKSKGQRKLPYRLKLPT